MVPGRSTGRAARALPLALLFALPSALGAQAVGFQGPSLAGSGPTIGAPSVTASRPESKLWFHDGAWWGSLWSASALEFRIHRLAPGSHAWVDTGVAVESRPDSHSDALWNGEKLYLASHEFGQGAGGPSHDMLVLRYSYTGSQFQLDAGFPVVVGNSGTESLVIDQDSTGRLWVAWMQELRVRYAYTLGTDTSWSAPAILPGCTSDVTSDDICGLVAFGGHVGVLWSDRALDTFFFAAHADAAAPTTWLARESALGGGADDHLDLAADSDGRVIAVVKDDGDVIELLVRAAGGGWSAFPVAVGGNNLTRPIVVLDEPNERVHVYATRMGQIRRKSSALSPIAFPVGTGTLVMSDPDGALNDPTSAKRGPTRRSGIVVLAANTSASGHYWHHEERGPAAQLELFAQGTAPNLSTRSYPLRVTGATPGGWVRFDTPDGGGRTLGATRADASGAAELSLDVPPALAGTTWRVRASEPATRRASATVEARL